jgi:hypothetical protein
MRQSRDFSSRRRLPIRVKAEKQFASERAKIEIFLFSSLQRSPHATTAAAVVEARAKIYFDDFPNQFDCKELGGWRWNVEHKMIHWAPSSPVYRATVQTDTKHDKSVY